MEDHVCNLLLNGSRKKVVLFLEIFYKFKLFQMKKKILNDNAIIDITSILLHLSAF